MGSNRTEQQALMEQLLPRRWALVDRTASVRYVSFGVLYDGEAKLYTEDPDAAATWHSPDGAAAYKSALMANGTTLDVIEHPYSIGDLYRARNNAITRRQSAMQTAERAVHETALIESRLQAELADLVKDGTADVVLGNQLRVGDVILGADGKRKTVVGAELCVTYDDNTTATFSHSDVTTLHRLRTR